MTDDEFLRALERCELAASEFRHAEHVRAGYLYLRALGFAQALERMRSAVLRFASHLGCLDKYHETVTVAYLALIEQHRALRGDGGGWSGFQRENPELFEKDLLLRFYSKAQLESDLARRTFVLPSRETRH